MVVVVVVVVVMVMVVVVVVVVMVNCRYVAESFNRQQDVIEANEQVIPACHAYGDDDGHHGGDGGGSGDAGAVAS